MITTEAIFDNIREQLLEIIGSANESIYVAVAWFTERSLFQSLIEKQKNGISVELIVVKDDINMSPIGLDFNALTRAGGKFFSFNESLMHNKFCVIDQNIVVTGSYNWTFKAERENLENIIITKGDFDLALSFISEFYKISGQNELYSKSTINRTLKRLKIIQSLIDAQDNSEISRHLEKLRKENNHPDITLIIISLENAEYAKANKLIDEFSNSFTQITKFIDPLVSALKLEIKALKNQILAIDNEIAQLEQVIRHFNFLFNQILGSIVEELLRLKKEFYSTIKDLNEEFKTNFTEAETEYQHFNESQSDSQSKQFKIIDQNQLIDLKKLYREAANLCHPDKVDPSQSVQAEEVFKELQEAYKNQDLRKVTMILNTLRQGVFSIEDPEYTDTEVLKEKVKSLRENLGNKINKIKSLKETEAYSVMISQVPYDEYFMKQKELLQKQLDDWKNQH